MEQQVKAKVYDADGNFEEIDVTYEGNFNYVTQQTDVTVWLADMVEPTITPSDLYADIRKAIEDDLSCPVDEITYV